MTNFIPLFPLNIVAYPGEHLNLHIFEPRYKQLIQDCFSAKKEFGIPTVLKNAVAEYGTTVEILSIEKVHADGEMDIRTRGQKVFKVLESIREIPGKLYMGAIVHYPDNEFDVKKTLMDQLMDQLKVFHDLLEVSKVYKTGDRSINVYDIAHHAGLSLEQEYELLCLFKESQRQEYLKRHLMKTIPTILELKNLKKRIEMNGYFRKLSVDDNLDNI